MGSFVHSQRQIGLAAVSAFCNDFRMSSGRRARRAGLAVLGAVGLLLAVSCTGAQEDAPGPGSGSGSAGAGVDSVLGSPGGPPTIDQVESAVRERITLLRGVFPGVIALVRVGDQTRTVAVGLADTKAGTAMSAVDTFPVASISKTMVATAVMQQVEAGTLTLDDTVEQWLPGLVVQGDRMTVRQLLSHRSGIHDLHEDLLSDSERQPPDTLTDHEIVRLAGAQSPDFPPASDGSYSDTGYVVLGMILEKAAGAPLREVLATRLWEPAGMDDTVMAPKRWDVHGYNDEKDVTADSWLNVGQAAGGVVGTAADVDRFFQHLWAGDLLDPGTVAVMTRPTETSPFGYGRYGLGVWIVEATCGKALGHSGSLPGYVIQAWTLKGEDRSVVVMVNDGDEYDTAQDIADTALCSP